MGKSGDGFDIETRAVAVADVGDLNELGPLIDGAFEVGEGNVAIRPLGHVLDDGPARPLRVPDLRPGRELEVRDDDLVACS